MHHGTNEVGQVNKCKRDHLASYDPTYNPHTTRKIAIIYTTSNVRRQSGGGSEVAAYMWKSQEK